MSQGFKDFSGILHHFVMAKFATSSIRIKGSKLRGELLQEKGQLIHAHSGQKRPDNFDDSIPGKIFEGEILITTLLKKMTYRINPSNAEATFVQSTRKQSFPKTI